MADTEFDAVVRSEFATIGVQVSDRKLGQCIVITDLRTGKSLMLDPLELESLAWSRHSDLEPLVNPATSRWSGTGA